ncbi:MAG: GTPase domain-containing protein [Gemmatales bacterium]|nr:GTPase domain-containing protein [Gemmatales bacterium]
MTDVDFPNAPDAVRGYLTLVEKLGQFLEKLRLPEMGPEELLYVQALLRNYVVRCFENQQEEYWHIAVIGGGGAGKSSVVNILLGENLAETNPQAGYTRHPSAFCQVPPRAADFLPRLRSVPARVPGNVDEDLYDLRVPQRRLLPREFVVWDNPDVTTIHASHYTHRVIEVLGLADVVVYVASAQRYNDRVPSQYLAMLADSGKPTIACLTKVPEADISMVSEHFQREVLQPLTQQTHVPCLVIPYKPLEQLENPQATEVFRRQLLEQIDSWLQERTKFRQDACIRILRYLERKENQWQALVQPELEALGEWHRLVEVQGENILDRYNREFLSRERLAIFDEAMIRLLELLEIPVLGRLPSSVLEVLRIPWRGLKWLWTKLTSDTIPSGPLQDEREILTRALETSLGQLWREAQHRQQNSIFWQRLSQVLDPSSAWQRKIIAALGEHFSKYEGVRRELIETIAGNIYGSLKANPAALNTLRGTKLAVELASIAGILISGGLNLWDLALVPLATSMIQALTEFLGSQYVEVQRENARQMQLSLVTQYLVQPVCQLVAHSDPASEWQELRDIFPKLPHIRKFLMERLHAPQT